MHLHQKYPNSTWVSTALFLLLFFIPHSSAYAQSTISGKVLDSKDRNAVIGAAVQILRSDSTQVMGEATDINGKYLISGIKAGKYILRITYVSYETYSRSISIGETSTTTVPDILLVPVAQMLDAITVKGRASDMRILGDTLEFSAANFGLQAGATLEDLVRRIPGAEIDSEGKITINGKRIAKMMIDGKDFFAGDTKVASKNIPAAVIEKLQVLDRQSEMSRLSGFDDGEEETVINISIKPGQKKGVFGNAFAGYGTDQRYEVNAMVNRFAGENQWTILAGSNNTNNMGFSDIATEGNSSAPAMQGGGGRSSGRSGRRSGDQTGITTSTQIGGNAYFAISPKFEAGGDGRYGYADQFVDTQSLTQNIQPEGNTNQSENSRDKAYKHTGGVDMKLVWKPDEFTEIMYTPSLDLGRTDRRYYSAYSTVNAIGEQLNHGTFDSKEEIKNWGTRQRLDLSRKLNDAGRTVSLSLDMRYGSTANNGFYRSAYETLTQAPVLLDINLNNRNGSSSYRARLSWVEPLGSNFFLQAMYHFSSSRQTAERTAFTPSTPSLYDLSAPEYGSDYTNTLLTHRAGLNVKKVFAKSDLTLGLSIDPSTIRSVRNAGSTFSADTTISRLYISPSLRFNYRPDRNTSLRIGYRGWTTQPSIDQLLPAPDITTPLIRVEGNPNLRPSYWNNMMMRLQSFSPASRQAVYAGLHAAYIFDDIVPNTVFNPRTGERTTTYENVSGNATVSLFGSFSRPLFVKDLSIRLGTMLGYNHRQGFVNGSKNVSKALNNSNHLSFVYQNDWIYTAAKGSLAFYYVKNSIPLRPTPTTWNYGAGYEIGLTLPLGLRIESDVNYSTNVGFSDSFRLTQWLWNASVSYSFLKDKAATFRVKFYDILDQRSAVSRNVTALSTSEERTNTLGRYAMLHFIYRFNIFSGGSTQSDMHDKLNEGGSYRHRM